jgi:hypothetical protein
LVGKPEVKRLLGRLSVDGKIISKKKRCGLDRSGLGWGPVAGSCECLNESIKGGKLFN